MRKIFILLGLLLFMIPIQPLHAVAEEDFAFFTQVVNGMKTVYLCKADGTGLKALISGKDIKSFVVGKHFLYFTNHQLFEFDVTTKQSRLLSKFDEDSITVEELSDNASGGPDQILVIAESTYERNMYIVEFPDGGVRTVQSSFVNSNSNSNSNSSLKSYSSDENWLAVIRLTSMNYRFELLVQQKINNKFKTIWTIPHTMTIIPERPIWAPNSHMIAFYAKKFDSLEGFYSLYLFHLDTHELELVQEQVFSKLAFGDLSMGSFVPNWSSDSKYLIFQYQPYGLPTESSIIKYDVGAKKKTILINNRGRHLYPTWSPSNRHILFIWNRNIQNQLFSMDANGENLKQLSPTEGSTDWAVWYKPDGGNQEPKAKSQ